MKSFFIILFLWTSWRAILAQNENLDSLYLVIQNAKNDTSRAYTYIALSEKYYYSNIDSVIPLCEKAIEIAERAYSRGNSNEKHSFLVTKGIALTNIGAVYQAKGLYDLAYQYYMKSIKVCQEINDKSGTANVLNNIGVMYSKKGDVMQSIKYFEDGLKVFKELNDLQGSAWSLNNLGRAYNDQGNLRKAFECYSQSLKINEKINDKNGIANSLNNIAFIYTNQGDKENALKYFERSLKLKNGIGDVEGVTILLNNIGAVYDDLGNKTKALEYYNKSLDLRLKIDDKFGMGVSYNNIANIYYTEKKIDEASNYYKKSLDIRKKIGDNKGIAATYINLGKLYLNKDNKIAAAYSDSGLKLSNEIRLPVHIRDAEFLQSKIDSVKRNYKDAYEHYKRYVFYRDSLNNEQTRKVSIKNQLNYEFEKKAFADSVRVEEEKKTISSELKLEKTKNYTLVGGFALVLIFAVFMVNRFKISQKQKQIISTQKQIVDEKHKEITDSINYAERIQRSFLATEMHLNDNLQEYFIFFKPKDIVSGDFYWSATLSNGHFAIVTADSTGHGVPGAIMSLLNITSLEKAIENHNEPAEILNETRNIIINRLKKDGSLDGGKDGMDCSLCVFDFKEMELNMAAAHNPIWIVRQNELIEIKPDKMPVGKHDKQNLSFTNHNFKLQKDDIIYTLTDGFPDQFGGEKGKKFMSKNLRELLLNNANLPMNKQKEILVNAFEKWIGNLEQVDDVTVIGIRV